MNLPKEFAFEIKNENIVNDIINKLKENGFSVKKETENSRGSYYFFEFSGKEVNVSKNLYKTQDWTFTRPCFGEEMAVFIIYQLSK